MTKHDLVVSIAEDIDVAQIEIKDVLERFFARVGDALARRERVELRGFGIFNTKVQKAKIGRNPKTGEKVSIPEKRVVVFKPGKAIKEKVERGGEI
jgi:nucleoid DNA-binding protein